MWKDEIDIKLKYIHDTIERIERTLNQVCDEQIENSADLRECKRLLKKIDFENSQTRLKNELKENEEKIELLTNENEYIKEAMNNNHTEYWIKSKKED